MKIELTPIGYVHNFQDTIEDDNWGHVISEIILDEKFQEESLDGIEEFSHLEIIFFMDRVDEEQISTGKRHPRENTNWPRVGIFSQRARNRPNRLGITMVKFLNRNGRSIFVSRLDALNETPVLDIKPVMQEFLPKEEIREPKWSKELMQFYYK